MKKRKHFLTAFIVAAMSVSSAFAQEYNITFAILGSSEKPATVKVENTTQSTEKTLAGSDVLNLVKDISSGIDDINDDVSNALQVYPNPVKETAIVAFSNPAAGKVSVRVVNSAGVQVAFFSSELPQGEINYTLSGLSTGNYVVHVQSADYRASCIILSQLESTSKPSIVISSTNQEPTQSMLKSTKSVSEIIQMQYTTGDVLKFTATLNAKSAYIDNYTATQNDAVEFSFIYTVTFNNWDNAELSTFDGEYGDAVTYPSHPNNRNGYTANGWDTENATVPANDDLVITAQYSTVPYTITYNNVGTKNGAANPATYTIETADITLVVPTDSAGYTFGGWFTDAACTDTVSTPAIAQGSMGDNAFYAKWGMSTYHITYNNVGTKNGAANPATYTIETADITLVVPTDSAGYTFRGWFTDVACTDTVSTPAIAQGSMGDNAFYAKWVITDSRDGNEYRTVTIKNQIWMAENLAYLPSVNQVADGSEDAPGSYYYVYGYNGTDVNAAKTTSNYTTYGVLYNRTAALNACPTGWHLPTDAEWKELTDYLAADGHSYTKGTALKATSGWNDDGNGTDDYGFTALPGDHRNIDGYFGNPIGLNGCWWSSSEYSTTEAWLRLVVFNASYVSEAVGKKESGFSVRCVRD